MRERIIIAGAGVMQKPAIRIAKELGFFTVVVDGSRAAPCTGMADQFEHIDLKDKEGIEAFARSLRDSSGGLGGIMTAGTDFSATVAWVAEKLNLPGIPYEAALNASDKARMRSCFNRAGLPSPKFITITADSLDSLTCFDGALCTRPPEGGLPSSNTVDYSCAGTGHIDSSTPLDRALFTHPRRTRPPEGGLPSLDTVDCSCAGTGHIDSSTPLDRALFTHPRRARPPEGGLPSLGTVDCSCAGTGHIDSSTPLDGALLLFPLVVKPVDNMGGRGCRRVDTMEEFREAAADALRFSRSGRAIVEAFMDGPEFSVDAIVCHDEIIICGLADRHIFFPPYFIEMGHTMPTAIAPGQQEALLETFCAGVRALGLAGGQNIGAAKGDIKLTSRGPMIGEIAARLSGGYMSGWTYPYSSGVEPVRAAILAAMGRKPDGLVPLKTWTSAERAFISIPGTVKSISGTKTARNQPHVRDLFLRIAEGGKVDFPKNNVSKCGNIISAAPIRAAAVEAAETAARSILIRLDPADKETAVFLSASGLSSPCSPLFPPSAFPLTPELAQALSVLPETALVDKGVNSAPRSLLPDSCFLIPFPAFTASGLKDYMGRTAQESLDAVRRLTGFSLPKMQTESAKFSDNKSSFLGKSFWAALIRGGYQGAVYYIDQLRGEH